MSSSVTSSPAGTVTLVSARSLRILERFRGFAYPHDVEIARGGRYAYLTEKRGGRLAGLDLRRRRLVARLAVGSGPHDLALNPRSRRLWVTHDPGDGSIPIVDLRRWTRPSVAARISATGGSPHDIGFAPDGRRVFVTYWSSGLLGAFATRPRRRLLFRAKVGVETHHLAFTPAGHRVWVTDNAAGTVGVVSARTGRRRRLLAAGPRPHHVAILGGRAVVALHGASELAVYSLRGRRVRTIRVGSGPHGVALARD